MKKLKNISIVLLIILSIILIIAIGLSSIKIKNLNKDKSDLNSQLDQHKSKVINLEKNSNEYNSVIEFTKSYAVALNNIHIALMKSSLSINNERLATDTAQSGQYTYSGISNIYESSLRYNQKAQKLLSKSENILKTIE